MDKFNRLETIYGVEIINKDTYSNGYIENKTRREKA